MWHCWRLYEHFPHFPNSGTYNFSAIFLVEWYAFNTDTMLWILLQLHCWYTREWFFFLCYLLGYDIPLSRCTFFEVCFFIINHFCHTVNGRAVQITQVKLWNPISVCWSCFHCPDFWVACKDWLVLSTFPPGYLCTRRGKIRLDR